MNEREFIATVASKLLKRLDDDAATRTMMMGNVNFCAGPYEICPVQKPAKMSSTRYDFLWLEMKDASRIRLENLSKRNSRLRRWAVTMKTQLMRALKDEDALEVAILAGLLTREGALKPHTDQLSVAILQTWRTQACTILADISVSHLIERLATTTLDPAAIDALFALDELCAAAWWAGAESAPLTDAIALATNIIRAFPEPWSVLSPDASDQMASLPPNDPSRPLWRTIEAAQWCEDGGTPMTVADALEAYRLEEDALKTKAGETLSFFVRCWLVYRTARALGQNEEEITVNDVLAFTPTELKAKADDVGVECFGPVRLRILYNACRAASNGDLT